MYKPCGLYLSPFADTSTVYSEMPEIPFVAAGVTKAGRSSTTVKDHSFWSTLFHPRAKPAHVEPKFGLADGRPIPPRHAPLLSSSSSGSSSSSSQTKVTPIKSSLSSSSKLKSRAGSSTRRKTSVKFAEKPTIHYHHSYDAEPEHPTWSTTPPKDRPSKLKRLVGSMAKSRGQAVPARPSISGPYPIYCMALARSHEPNVRPARSQASLRSAGSASSASSFRTLWHRFTCPNG
jgi:hypothetical protein